MEQAKIRPSVTLYSLDRSLPNLVWLIKSATPTYMPILVYCVGNFPQIGETNINVKNKVYKTVIGDVSKTAKIHHFVKSVTYCFITTVLINGTNCNIRYVTSKILMHSFSVTSANIANDISLKTRFLALHYCGRQYRSIFKHFDVIGSFQIR